MFGFLCVTFDRRAHREHVLRHHAASLVRGGVISLTSHPAVAMRFVRTRAWRYLIALLQVARRRRAEAPTARAHGEASPAVHAHPPVTPQGRCAGAGAAMVGAVAGGAREGGREEERGE